MGLHIFENSEDHKSTSGIEHEHQPSTIFRKHHIFNVQNIIIRCRFLKIVRNLLDSQYVWCTNDHMPNERKRKTKLWRFLELNRLMFIQHTQNRCTPNSMNINVKIITVLFNLCFHPIFNKRNAKSSPLMPHPHPHPLLRLTVKAKARMSHNQRIILISV